MDKNKLSSSLSNFPAKPLCVFLTIEGGSFPVPGGPHATPSRSRQIPYQWCEYQIIHFVSLLDQLHTGFVNSSTFINPAQVPAQKIGRGGANVRI